MSIYWWLLILKRVIKICCRFIKLITLSKCRFWEWKKIFSRFTENLQHKPIKKIMAKQSKLIIVLKVMLHLWFYHITMNYMYSRCSMRSIILSCFVNCPLIKSNNFTTRKPRHNYHLCKNYSLSEKDIILENDNGPLKIQTMNSRKFYFQIFSSILDNEWENWTILMATHLNLNVS